MKRALDGRDAAHERHELEHARVDLAIVHGIQEAQLVPVVDGLVDKDDPRVVLVALLEQLHLGALAAADEPFQADDFDAAQRAGLSGVGGRPKRRPP